MDTDNLIKLQCHILSELPLTMEANVKKYSRQKEYGAQTNQILQHITRSELIKIHTESSVISHSFLSFYTHFRRVLKML